MKKMLAILTALMMFCAATAAFAEADDKAAADNAAALIDAIYVQEWTEETDAQIQAAREA